MIKFLAKYGTAVVAILGDRLITKVLDMAKGVENLSASEKEQFEEALRSQLLAAVAYERFGISGVATLYDAGAISVSDFNLYRVKAESYRLPGAQDSRIAQIESKEEGGAFGFSALIGGSIDLPAQTNDPEAARKMYTYLASQNI